MLHRITIFIRGKSPIHRLTPALSILLPTKLNHHSLDKISSTGLEVTVTGQGPCMCWGGVHVSVGCEQGTFLAEAQRV